MVQCTLHTSHHDTARSCTTIPHIVASWPLSATFHHNMDVWPGHVMNELNCFVAWLVLTGSWQLQNVNSCWAGFRQCLDKRSRLAQLACHDRYGIQKYMSSLHMLEPPVVQEWGENTAGF